MRKNHLKFTARLLAGLLTCGAVSSAMAGEVYVIANAGVNVSPEEIREVFIGDKQMAGSVKLAPLDNASAQADFLALVVKMDPNKYASVWSKKAFREGINPPPTRATDAEIINAVKTTPGAIGYVSKAPAGVKVIQKF